MIANSEAVIQHRWRVPYNANKANLKRRDVAVQFIEPNSRVLDLGCGAMAMRDALPTGCSYTGVDLLPHFPGVTVANLNLMEFPEGEFDVTTLLGVVEYLENPVWVFRKIKERSKTLVLSYETRYFWTPRTVARAHRTCRLNFFRRSELKYILAVAGWRLDQSVPFKNANSRIGIYQRIYVCTQASAMQND